MEEVGRKAAEGRAAAAAAAAQQPPVSSESSLDDDARAIRKMEEVGRKAAEGRAAAAAKEEEDRTDDAKAISKFQEIARWKAKAAALDRVERQMSPSETSSGSSHGAFMQPLSTQKNSNKGDPSPTEAAATAKRAPPELLRKDKGRAPTSKAREERKQDPRSPPVRGAALAPLRDLLHSHLGEDQHPAVLESEPETLLREVLVTGARSSEEQSEQGRRFCAVAGGEEGDVVVGRPRGAGRVFEQEGRRLSSSSSADAAAIRKMEEVALAAAEARAAAEAAAEARAGAEAAAELRKHQSRLNRLLERAFSGAFPADAVRADSTNFWSKRFDQRRGSVGFSSSTTSGSMIDVARFEAGPGAGRGGSTAGASAGGPPAGPRRGVGGAPGVVVPEGGRGSRRGEGTSRKSAVALWPEEASAASLEPKPGSIFHFKGVLGKAGFGTTPSSLSPGRAPVPAPSPGRPPSSAASPSAVEFQRVRTSRIHESVDGLGPNSTSPSINVEFVVFMWSSLR